MKQLLKPIWKTGFQKTPYAWKISDELLYTKRSIEAVSFASQTIRSKVLYDFAELPSESHNQLMESILSHVMKMDNQVALTQEIWIIFQKIVSISTKTWF